MKLFNCMKQIFILILTIGLLFSFANKAEATKAYPYPISVTQPDGSKITIQVFGDEFLSWTVCGNRLVTKAADGYYYYANFDANGLIKATTVKASGFYSITKSGNSTSPVTPPAAAINRANKLREQVSNALRQNNGNILQQSVQGNASSLNAVSGSKHTLVVLIEFSDTPFTIASANTAFSNMLNQTGYTDNGGTGSVAQYYAENSKGVFTPEFDVIGPYKVSQPLAYYSNNKGFETPGARDLLIEACKLADASVDFSKYDDNGDGTIDNIFFYFAGHNMAEGATGTIWPHAYGITSNDTFDGKKLGRYSCSSELKGASGSTMCGIGTFCHEFGHTIGLPDLYDTDYETNGSGNGLSYFSLMSSGNYLNEGKTPPFLTWVERNILGWTNKATELEVGGNYTLEPINLNNKVYMTSTTNTGEFFLYENRQQEGWDKYLPAHGMLIYHIDQSNNIVNGMTAKLRWATGKEINAYAAHQCCDIVEAIPESKNPSKSQMTFPGSSNVTSFTSSTQPAAIEWNGNPTGYNLTNITETGKNIAFNLTVDNSRKINGQIVNASGFPITGAVVTVSGVKTSISTNGAISVMRKVVSYANQSTLTATTDHNGKFLIDCGELSEAQIEVKCEGYNITSQTMTMAQKGYYYPTILLYDNSESKYEEVKKYSGSASQFLGYNKTGITILGVVQMTAAELTSHVGKKLTTISFTIGGTSAYSVDAIVYFGTQKVLVQNIPSPRFGSMNTVDISAANLFIPANTDIKVGYSLRNSDSKFPLACAEGTSPGAGLVSSNDGNSWDDLAENNCSLIISFNVYDASSTFYDFGYNIISGIKESYTVGEELALTLAESKDKPESIVWYFDNAEQKGGNKITLTKGEHVIKAVLKYSDGSQEIIVQEIQVN